MYDDRISVSADSKNWKYYQAKSKYIDVRKGRSEFGKKVNAHYARLVANPNRNEFYRFVVHEPQRDKNRTFLDMLRYPSDFSIIILDKDLHIIGETVFPSDIFDMHGYFFTKDGLYLSLSNPFNPDYNVDLLEFRLFRLTKNEK